jgi:hypothetical protein
MEVDGGVGQDAWIQWLVDRKRQVSCSDKKEGGSSARSCPLLRPQGGRSSKSPGLEEVIAEGGDHHVVDGLRTLAHAGNGHFPCQWLHRGSVRKDEKRGRAEGISSSWRVSFP